MKMAYNGSQAVVDVPDAGIYGVKRGEPVDIKDETTRGRLRRQGWSYVKTDAKDKDGDDS